ncbi:MAG: hypothetical protein OXR72_06255 [Gemmatimonadota bacterium]|nr:hypothetical protein [Gemmatimonadota bacterium]
MRLRLRTFRQHFYLPSVSPTVLEFDPGAVARVDFGRGSTIEDVFAGQTIATWIFVMVLAWSRNVCLTFLI